MGIPTTHDIRLLRIMLCTIVFFFGATYAITLFIDSFLCVSNICSDSFRTLSVWNGKIVFLRILYSWLSFCLQAEFVISFVVCLSFFWCSCLEAPLCNTIVVTVEHVFERDLTCLTQLFNFFSLFFFIMYPQSFLSRRAYALVQPHCRSLLLLTMEQMCFATTFTQWERSARKDGSGISSWSFPFDDLRTWPREPLDGFLSTARIVLSSSLTMISMTKKCDYASEDSASDPYASDGHASE